MKMEKGGEGLLNMEHLDDRISEIYRQYYLDVYRFLICFSGNQSEAEDMTQEVFIRVLNNYSNLHKVNHLKTWIFSIAKHVSIDHYRKKRLVGLFTAGFFTQFFSADKEPSEVMEQYETRKLVHAAISKLKPHYRAVVILRGINEFSIKETAEILQCNESKVKVSYHRALKDLKKKLNFEMEEVIQNAK